MRPFQQFRLWSRRAPVGERWAAGVVTAVVVAGLAWLAVPPSDDDSAVTEVGTGPVGAADATSGESAVPGDGATVTTQAAAAGAKGTGPTASGTPTGTGSAGQVAAVTGTGDGTQGGCVSPPGSDQGVTEKEIKIALLLVELAGATGNETVNVPPEEEQKAAYEAIIDDLNDNGGVACRKLRPVYFTINPLDQANLQQTCLDVAEAGVFYVNDLGGYAAFPALVDCYAQHKIPFYNGNYLPQSQLDKAYPYLFAGGVQDLVYFNAVFALKQQGFFDPAKGFKKLGFFYQDCIPEHPKKFLAWLEQAGVPSDQIVQYNFGCAVSLYTPPSDIAQAVLRFRQAGVTHVTHVRGDGDWFNFTRAAQQQGFKPKYGFGDVSTSFSSYGTLSPNWENADGATLITAYRFNEERTPNYPRSAGTERCQKIMSAHGQPDMYKQKLGMGGVACNQLWFFASAANHAPELTRTGLAAGLNRGGPLDFSYPLGPATFPTPRTTFGGNFWRTLTANAGCSCWQITDATFHPTFPGFK